MLSTITDGIRSVMSELYPPVLEDYGLGAALLWYRDKLRHEAGLHVQVTGEQSVQGLSPSSSMALFRIAQEALVNVIKHAGVDQAEVALDGNENEISMVVLDHGRGFKQSESSPGADTHWGISLMRERATALGGRLELISAPSQGTSVKVQIPRHSK